MELYVEKEHFPRVSDRTYSTIEELFDIVPPEIEESTKIILDGENNGNREEALKKCREFYKNNSLIMDILINNPGSSRFTELVYGVNSDEPEEILHPFIYDGKNLTEIDEWSLNTLPCQGVKDRLAKVIKHGDKYAREILRHSDEVVIGNFGSGLSRDAISLARNPEYGKHVKIDLIDTDQQALETAEKLAKYYGIDKQVRTINKSLTELNGGDEFKNRYNEGFLVGVLCPLPENICKPLLLKKIYPTLKYGSFLTASNASKVMGNGNPVSRFREVILGWGLNYKDENNLEEISCGNGKFSKEEHFYDKYMQNVMITIRKKGKE